MVSPNWVPAKAGTHPAAVGTFERWIPAFAGTTAFFTLLFLLLSASFLPAGAVERHITDYFAAHRGTSPAAGLYDRVLREIERPLIVATLGATRGNQIKAAHLLGLNRNTLRKKIRELDIPVVRGLK